MPRGSVKIQRVALNKHSKEDINLMQQMFDQMTGISNADTEIILPKYVKLRQLLINFIKSYNVLIGFTALYETFPEYQAEFLEITCFIEKIIKTCNIDISIEETVEKYIQISQGEINRLYNELKENECVKMIITTAGKLSRYSKMLENTQDLKDGFIKREPGLSMFLLSFSRLDFKALWISPKLTLIMKKFILTVLSHTYEISFQIYDVITSPNVDIRKFSGILVSNLDMLRKQIPRCDDAFNIIVKSVELLENNFKNYYKSSIEAENPTLILENFVIDVSTQHQSTGPRVTQQFRKIIMHMRKAASENKDPRVKRLFNMLNTQFKAMEEQTTLNKNEEASPEAETIANPVDTDLAEISDIPIEDIEEKENEKNNEISSSFDDMPELIADD